MFSENFAVLVMLGMFAVLMISALRMDRSLNGNRLSALGRRGFADSSTADS